jgi:hypothetical protein
MMVSLDMLIILFALAFFFWRASEDDLRAQQRGEEREGAAGSQEPLPSS